MKEGLGGQFHELKQKIAYHGDRLRRDYIPALQKETGHAYARGTHTASFRVVADHMRAAVFLIGDGVLPGNAEQGYFVRRLIRRSVRHADKLGLQAGKLADVVAVVANGYKEHYAEIYDSKIKIQEAIAHEETKFRETIEKGMKQFEKLATGDTISGYDAFVLFTTYGFPVELTQELATERGAVIDMSAFKEEMKKHQDASRAGAEQKFKGGLADHSEATTRLHTTHHLLLQRWIFKRLPPIVWKRLSTLQPQQKN
jgi:alanyl-tRNA synthetase